MQQYDTKGFTLRRKTCSIPKVGAKSPQVRGRTMKTKKCTQCEQVKPITEYYVKHDVKCGRAASCKMCQRKAKKVYRKSNPKDIMLAASKQRAKRKGLEHNITIEDIIIPEKCPVLGIKLQTGKGNHNYNSPTLDRIDTEKGYIKGNVEVISYRVNNIKGAATTCELKDISMYYYNKFKE